MNKDWQKKNKESGPDSSRTGQHTLSRPISCRERAGDEIKRADRWGQPISGEGDRRGTKHRGPSDQDKIDGPQPSSSSGHGEKNQETLALQGRRQSSPRDLPRPWEGDEGTRCTTPTLERGDKLGLIHGTVTCASWWVCSPPSSREVDIRASLDQKKGEVSWLWTRGVPASIERR
jgi:hypothetical protein